MAAVLVAAAILALQPSAPPAPEDQNSEVFQARSATDGSPPDFAALHAEVINGSPDPAWSAQTRTALLAAYHRRPAFIQGVGTLSVKCNASLCEVNGLTSAAPDGDALEAARWITLTGQALSLDLEIAHSRTTTGTPQQTIVVAYWRRRTD